MSILCIFGFHVWKRSPFVALGSPPAEYSVCCQRCGKWELRSK